MHELSLAIDVCRIAQEQLEPAQWPHLRVVALDVGNDAGVEASSLEFCLETLLSQPPFGAARPVITRLEGDMLRVAYLEVDDGRPDD